MANLIISVIFPPLINLGAQVCSSMFLYSQLSQVIDAYLCKLKHKDKLLHYSIWSVSYQGPMTESLSSGCHFELSLLYLSILLSLKKGRGLADTKLTQNFPLTLFSWVSSSKYNRQQLLTREPRTVFVTL